MEFLKIIIIARVILPDKELKVSGGREVCPSCAICRAGVFRRRDRTMIELSERPTAQPRWTIRWFLTLPEMRAYEGGAGEASNYNPR